MSNANIILFVALVSSLLAGANQLFGFFSKVNASSALLCLLVAICIVLYAPASLREQLPAGEMVLGLSPVGVSIFAALFVLLLGVGPYLARYASADHAYTRGVVFFERGHDSNASTKLAYSWQVLSSLGFKKQAALSAIPLAQTYARLGQSEKALHVIDDVKALTLNDIRLQARLDLVRSTIAMRFGQYYKAQRLLQQAEQGLVKGSSDEATWLQSVAIVNLAVDPEALIKSRQQIEASIAIFRKRRNIAGEIDGLINLATLPDTAPQEANEQLQKVLAIAKHDGNKRQLATIWLNIGVYSRISSSLAKAEHAYHNAKKLFEEIADLEGQAMVALNKAVIKLANDKALARRLVDEARARFASLEERGNAINPSRLAKLVVFQADIQHALGIIEPANKSYQHAIALVRKEPNTSTEVDIRINYGAFLLAQGQLKPADREFDAASSLLSSTFHSRHKLGMLFSNRGVWYQDIGDFNTARQFYEKALSVFTSLKLDSEVTQVKENIAILDAFMGQGDMQVFIRAKEVYFQKGQIDLAVKTELNLYLVDKHADEEQANRYIESLIQHLDTYDVDAAIELGVLTRILPFQVKAQATLLKLREKLLAVVNDPASKNDAVALGMVYIQLARIEQKLGNYKLSRAYAEKAEAFVDAIAFPDRVAVLSDLGFFLTTEANPNRGIAHFWAAFDFLNATLPGQAKSLMVVLARKLNDYKNFMDLSQHVTKLETLARTSTDSEVRSWASELMASLKSG